MKFARIVGKLAAVSALALPMVALAQAGLTKVTAPAGTSTEGLVDAVIKMLNFLLVLAALGALVFLIIGGARYIGSQGDEDAAAAAKNTILYSILGLIVIGLAAAIVNFFILSFGGG